MSSIKTLKNTQRVSSLKDSDIASLKGKISEMDSLRLELEQAKENLNSKIMD